MKTNIIVSIYSIAAIIFGILGKLIFGKYNHSYSSYLDFGNLTTTVGFGAAALCAFCFYLAYRARKNSQ